MTLRDYIGVLRERFLVVVVMISLVTLSAFVFSIRQKGEFSATARLLIEPVAPGTALGHFLNKELSFQRDVLTEGEYLRSSAVAERVIKRLKLKAKPNSLVDDIGAVPYGQTAVLLVTAKASTGKLASDLANTFSEEYISLKREQAAQEAQRAAEGFAQRITDIQTQLTEADKEIKKNKPGTPGFELATGRRSYLVSLMEVYEGHRQSLLDKAALEGRGVGQIIQHATIPREDAGPNHLRNTLLGIVVGIPLALGLALLLDSMNDTIKTLEEAERLAGTDALAVIPEDLAWRDPAEPFLASREVPHSGVAEAYRSVRLNLEFAKAGRSFVITSPGSQDGKTVTAANLAYAFAEAGRRVTVVSADLRTPRLHEFFDVEKEPGFSELARGEVRPIRVLQEAMHDLFVVSSGAREERPDRLFASIDVSSILNDLFPKRSTRVRATGNGHGGKTKNGGYRNGNGNGNGNGYRNGNGNGNGYKNGHGTKTAREGILLIDAPAVIGAVESASLTTAVDGVIIVIRVGATRKVATMRAVEQIKRVGGNVVGCVVVGVTSETPYDFTSTRVGQEAARIYSAITKSLSGIGK